MITPGGSEILNVWLRWKIDPDTQKRNLLSVHQSLKGAIDALPEEIKTEMAQRKADDPYVLNYLNQAIECRQVEE